MSEHNIDIVRTIELLMNFTNVHIRKMEEVEEFIQTQTEAMVLLSNKVKKLQEALDGFKNRSFHI
jgi:glycerol-3-phosphate responsive antiterminator